MEIEEPPVIELVALPWSTELAATLLSVEVGSLERAQTKMD